MDEVNANSRSTTATIRKPMTTRRRPHCRRTRAPIALNEDLMRALRVLLVASRGPVGGLQNALPPLVGFRANDRPSGLGCGVARNRNEHHPLQDCPPRRSHRSVMRRSVMFVIGIDPHKGSHTAAVLDEHERARRRAARACGPSSTRPAVGVRGAVRTALWAIEGATGHGRVVGAATRRCRRARARCAADAVGPGAAAGHRAGSTRPTPTTPARPRSSRCATRRCDRRARGSHRGAAPARRTVTTTWSRSAPERSVGSTPCCACWSLGGLPGRLSAPPEPRLSCGASVRPSTVGIERRRLAVEFLDRSRAASTATWPTLKARIVDAVTASATTVTDVFGVGPIMAAYLIGYSGDVRRFPTAGHYARYNGTAPIEASSDPRPTPAQPAREPPAEPRDPHRRRHPDRARHTRPRVLPPQTSRRQDPEGSDPRAQAAHQRRRLPPTPRRHRPLNEGSGRTTRDDSSIQRGRPKP